MNSANHILRHARILVSATAIWAGVSCALGAEPQDNRAQLIDSLQTELAEAHTPADSIQNLYHIFDLSRQSQLLENCKTLYYTAKRAGDTDTQLDMLRYWANIGLTMFSDSVISPAFAELDGIPDSEDKRQTELFMRSCMSSCRRFNSEEERARYLGEFMRRFTDEADSETPHEQVAQLFGLVDAFSGGLNGTLFAEYLDRLDKAIARLPKLPTNYVRNKYNTTAAIGYWYSGLPEKSVAADRDQLRNIANLEAHYFAKGRKYKNYDVQRYVIIRRMLRNQAALSVSEVDSLHRIVQQVAARNSDIASDYASNPSVRAGVLLAHENYAEALPLVKQQADRARGIVDKRYFLHRLIEVADLVGDTVTANNARLASATLLEDYISYKTAERTRELQIIYDVNSLRRQAAENEVERQKSRSTVLVIFGVILGLLVVLFLYLALRFRRMTRQLATANADLLRERANLLESQQNLIAARDKFRQAETEKSQLITYIGHEVMVPLNAIVDYSQMITEYVRDEGRDYLKRFAGVIEVNTRILQEIATDLQEFSMLDAHKLTVRLIPVDINMLGEISVDSVRPLVREGVALRLDRVTDADPIITTDPHRVEVVLMALLSNAAKFTEEGSITLGLSIDRAAQTATFTVSDTGIGVPPEAAEKIFERFERLNPEVEGTGLGLHNALMIARALKGSVTLDTEYPGPGSRFVFRVPINPEEEKKDRMKIGIIVAMDKELQLLLPLLSGLSEESADGFTLYRGTLGANEICIEKCGIGKVMAALGSDALIRAFAPDLVINTGVAGGVGGAAGVGDVVVATGVGYHDVWCGPENDSGQVQGFPATYACSPRVVELLAGAPGTVPGVIASGDCFVDTRERLDRCLAVRPEAAGVDMESGAIAQVCWLRGVDFACLRVISDTPGEVSDNGAQYSGFWEKAPASTFALVRDLIARL